MPHFPSRLRSVFKNFSEDFLELLEGLLTLNPKKRLTAAQALQSPFFTNEPLPFEAEKMPNYQPIHVLEAIQKRVQQQAQQQAQPAQTAPQVQQQQQQQVITPVKQTQPAQADAFSNTTKQLPTTTASSAASTTTTTIKPSISNNLPTITTTTPPTITIKPTEQPKPQQQQELIKPTTISQQQQEPTKISSSATTTPNILSQQNSPVNTNNNSNGNCHLKRSYDLVNDLNNYCTATDSEEEEECDCQVVEIDTDIEVEVDEDFYDDSDYYTEDEEEDSCTDSECEFNYITSRAIQTFAAQQPQFEDSVNPFLQPPKKQRTTSSFSSSFDVDVPIHLV
ncbi:protein serine/threonine kinase [Cavenderia fasciculata]|uniref:Protein serine/threonine kinase n=1 Tax=Cavenderia fasciculata TaxID=261658 RepID=F4PLF6_CACFS|nr:protein serine/threonine kinase [Cavenderia fasciculata]EGG23378.1 protein serine/threonine kinase [Cavenderia fasciculata]|eukprot:XP_004361229.1 protein serine/threonine kinase [Cavenderia fasciculata]